MHPRINEYGQPIGAELPDWTPRPKPECLTLEGHYCRLEPFNATAHAHALYHAYAQAADGRDWTWMFTGPFTTESEYLHYAQQLASSPDALHFTVIDRHSHRPLGTLALMRIDTANGTIEVGHVAFSPALKRTRIATEAHYLLMRYALEVLGYRRYEWKCDSLNAASRQAAERLGFQYEGTFRQAVVYRGRTRDTAWFSLLDSEWPQNKAALEAWLTADNFDAEGQQKRTLQACRTPR